MAEEHTMKYQDIPRPILKPSKSFTKATSAEGVRNNLEWLKRHHQEYRGQWVALNEGVLVGAHESMVELHKTLKYSEAPKSTVFINLKFENGE
jgi:hypothetical protein